MSNTTLQLTPEQRTTQLAQKSLRLAFFASGRACNTSHEKPRQMFKKHHNQGENKGKNFVPILIFGTK